MIKQNRIEKRKSLLQYAAMLVLLLVGGTACNRVEVPALSDNQRAVELMAYKPTDGDQTTKAAPKEAFVAGDKIHLSAKFTLSVGGPQEVYACMQYDAKGNWAACEGTKLVWPLKATKATFIAYYIPNATSALADQAYVANLSFSELSAWANDKGGDPLKATATDVSVGGAVYLQFAHMCSKLTFVNLEADITELRLSGANLSSGLSIKRVGGLLTDGLSSDKSAITHMAKGGAVSFLLPAVAENEELRLLNKYSPYHQIILPAKLEAGKHYTLDITKLVDNNYSDAYKEELWNKNPLAPVVLGTEDIGKYLQAIAKGESFIKDNVQILAVFQEGNNSVVTQLRDVDFDEESFTPVNLSANIIFNGNGHTVKNVTIQKAIAEEHVALFGLNEGVIKNLTLENVTVADNLASSTYVGTLTAENRGTIDNVKIKFSLGNKVQGSLVDKGALWVGGLVGYNDGVIKNVVLSGDFTVEGANATNKLAHIGGLAGQTSGTVENCVVHNATANTTGVGTFRIGGFVGAIGDGRVTQCAVGGAVNVQETVDVLCAGGFVGYSSAVETKECSSNATVTVAGAGSAAIGGFVGQMENTKIDNCHATGAVQVSGTVATPKGVAGLVGWLAYKGGSSHIINCSTISAVAAASGGLVGFVAENTTGAPTTNNGNSTIHNSFSKNGATSSILLGDGVKVTNCHHNGKDMSGNAITIDALNSGRGAGLKWVMDPNLYGVPYLNRKK